MVGRVSWANFDIGLMCGNFNDLDNVGMLRKIEMKWPSRILRILLNIFPKYFIRQISIPLAETSKGFIYLFIFF